MFRIIFLFIFIILLSAKVDAADLYVQAGETVSNGGVRFGDTQYVYGTTNYYVIDGDQIIGSGGIANTSIIYPFSSQTVLSGGISHNTTLFGYGRQDVYGVANETQAASQAVINLYSGGQLTGTTTLNGGILNIYDRDEMIPVLKMADGTVNILPVNGLLEINALTGDGQFRLQSNFGQNAQPLISFGAASGNFGLAITDSSSETVLPVRIDLIDKNQNMMADFYLIGNAVDVGAYQYLLAENADGWYLERSLNNTDTSIIAKNTYTSLNSVFYAHFQNLNVRMGEIRSAPKKSGLWLRGFGRNLDLTFLDNTSSKINIGGFQTGFDLPISQSLFNLWLMGVDYGFSNSRQKYDRDGSGRGNTNSLGFYSTMITGSGLYFDLSANYYWHKQKIISYLPIQYQVDSKYEINAMGFSVETGKRWMLGDNYFVEPQFQLRYIKTDDISYRTSQNTLVQGKNSNSKLGRIGFMLGKKLSEGSEVFVKNNVLHEMNGKSKISVADYTFHEKLAGTFYQIGVGINGNLNQKWQVYGNISTLLSDDISIPFDFNFGIRYEL